MAKTYIDIVKYMVEASFDIRGLVEKPDIIGAVFGQTEGLLGGDLDLRELQKNGKIGRIEIDTQVQGSRTVGRLHLPSSLGRVETCILAAAIESVDRVGPFETAFKVGKIEDTRSEKRKRILNRAKELMKVMMTTEIPDSRELSELVESDVKASVVTTYGPENLSAGPEIDSNEEVILVEGRADVVTLLKNDIANCIAVGGASGIIPKTIVDLCGKKETTLFTDGDRGGEIILKSIANVADLDFVARAPDGKEVEELTRKEIIKALRARVPIDQLFPNMKRKNGAANAQPREEPVARMPEQRPQPPMQQQRPMQPQQSFQQRDQRDSRGRDRPSTLAQQQYRQQSPPRDGGEILSPSSIVNNLVGSNSKQNDIDEPQVREEIPVSDLGIKDLRESARGSDNALGGIPSIQHFGNAGAGSNPDSQKYEAALDELHNTLRGRLYDGSGSVLAEVPIRELIQVVQDTKDISTIVFDGIITQRLIELANKSGVKAIYGIRASQITRRYSDMILFTKERGML